MNQSLTFFNLFISYLNIIGLAVVAGFLITLGLHLIFPKLKIFNKKAFLGISLILIALILIVQKLALPGVIYPWVLK